MKNKSPVLAYPFQITGLKTERVRNAARKGRKRRFPGLRIRMMRWYVDELRACAEALGWRFDAFLYHSLLQAKRDTERLFGMSHGELGTLSKADRAKLADHYQSVCEAGRKARLGDFYHPFAVSMAGEPLSWAVRDGWPIDRN